MFHQNHQIHRVCARFLPFPLHQSEGKCDFKKKEKTKTILRRSGLKNQVAAKKLYLRTEE